MFCSSCGKARHQDDDKFCAQCGCQFAGTSNESSAVAGEFNFDLYLSVYLLCRHWTDIKYVQEDCLVHICWSHETT